ncbi:unnamed protein product [Agarophyton chilense]
MYSNDIERVVEKALSALWRAIFSLSWTGDALEKDKKAAIIARQPPSHKHRDQSAFRSVRTILLLMSIVVSVIDVVALFALSTEGKDVADKPEFAIRMEEAEEIPVGREMIWYNPHEAQVRYEYVIRRLGTRIMFRNGTEFSVEVPRKLDALKDEKWAFNVALAEDDTYATVHTKDFLSEEKANFSEVSSQVTGFTESGKRLVHYPMAPRDIEKNACSGSMGATGVHESKDSGTFCFTDELRDMSCENKSEGETVSFSMKCSEIRVERLGGNVVPWDNSSVWWLKDYGMQMNGLGKASVMQMVSLRGYKRDEVSPSAMIVAALLTEYSSQSRLVRREFMVDVSVVIIPNWLVASSLAAFLLMVSLGTLASMYAAVKNLVLLNNWKELFISNVLEPLDCLNRRKKKEFRCVVGEGRDTRRRCHLYVEPGQEVTPLSWVQRKDIGGLKTA